MFLNHEANYILRKGEKLLISGRGRSVDFQHINPRILKVVIQEKGKLGKHPYLVSPGSKSLDPRQDRWKYTWIIR